MANIMQLVLPARFQFALAYRAARVARIRWNIEDEILYGVSLEIERAGFKCERDRAWAGRYRPTLQERLDCARFRRDWK